MSLTNLQLQWLHAAQELGLRVQVPYVVRFSDGRSVEVEVLLRGFGAREGMLVLSDYTTIEEKKDEIIAAGYGYSCYGPVPESEITCLEGFDDMLSDWGANPEKEVPNQPPEPTQAFGPSGSS
jgi:hypothetical protein